MPDQRTITRERTDSDQGFDVQWDGTSTAVPARHFRASDVGQVIADMDRALGRQEPDQYDIREGAG